MAPGGRNDRPRTNPLQEIEKPDLLAGQPPVVRESKLPMEILDRERVGIMKRQPSELRRYREGDLDEVVEVGFARHVAQAADIVGLERAQGAEAVEHHAGLGANDVPVHLEQSASGRVKEQVYGFRLGDCAVAREGQRIDAVEGQIVTAPDERFELGDHARAPGSGLLDLGHLAFEKPILNVSHRVSDPSWLSRGQHVPQFDDQGPINDTHRPNLMSRFYGQNSQLPNPSLLAPWRHMGALFAAESWIYA